ncbi:hypothetical protein CHCC20490_4404 [Bacillus paralicheniformis]|nr:hypothetical protein CHCC20490_4404 [Bacillus paralicheniformis]
MLSILLTDLTYQEHKSNSGKEPASLKPALFLLSEIFYLSQAK